MSQWRSNHDQLRLTDDHLIRLDEGGRILTKAEADSLVQRIYRLAQGGGWTGVQLTNWWQGELRWARNRVNLASDRRDIQLIVTRAVQGRQSWATTNQLDPASLEATVRAAERSALLNGGESGFPGYVAPLPELPVPKPTIWSEATYNLATEARGGVARAVTEPAEEKGMLSAGYLEVRAQAFVRQSNYEANLYAADHLEYERNGNEPTYMGRLELPVGYTTLTQGQCSMTVRDSQGTGSGWAGLSSYDWNAIDAKVLAERALQKGVASRNPVALEPGRYTVILEAQAVADLLEPLVNNLTTPYLSREMPEVGAGGPFYLEDDPSITLRDEPLHRSKVELKVVDERVTISHDPIDPLLSIVPEAGLQAITWIKDGVLTDLGQSRRYALQYLHENLPKQSRAIGYRMSGGVTSVEEMIKTTKRGLLVTRLWGVSEVRPGDPSVLCNGMTRDGLWLIENGTVTKAVKNFRFTESPLFVLNSLEQLGIPVPVFRPNTSPYVAQLSPAIVPPLKARDFSFTAMMDTV